MISVTIEKHITFTILTDSRLSLDKRNQRKLFKNPRAKPDGTKMFCSAFLNDARMCCFLPMQ